MEPSRWDWITSDGTEPDLIRLIPHVLLINFDSVTLAQRSKLILKGLLFVMLHLIGDVSLHFLGIRFADGEDAVP